MTKSQEESYDSGSERESDVLEESEIHVRGEQEETGPREIVTKGYVIRAHHYYEIPARIKVSKSKQEIEEMKALWKPREEPEPIRTIANFGAEFDSEDWRRMEFPGIARRHAFGYMALDSHRGWQRDELRRVRFNLKDGIIDRDMIAKLVSEWPATQFSRLVGDKGSLAEKYLREMPLISETKIQDKIKGQNEILRQKKERIAMARNDPQGPVVDEVDIAIKNMDQEAMRRFADEDPKGKVSEEDAQDLFNGMVPALRRDLQEPPIGTSRLRLGARI